MILQVGLGASAEERLRVDEGRRTHEHIDVKPGVSRDSNIGA